METPAPVEDARGRERVPPPPGSEALALVAADGVRLAGVHLPGTPGTASARVAFVVAHGFCGSFSHRRVDRVLRGLSRHGGVVAIDQRGHGASGGVTTLAHREPLDVEAASAWARAAGYDRVVTVGFSMGSSVVLRHAALLPRGQGHAGTDGVVSVSGTAFWYYRGTPPMRWLHRAVGTVTGRAYLRSRLGTRVDPRPWPDPPPLSPTESAARIRSQGIPLLIVHGDQDAFFPLDHPDALHRAAPGSEAWIEPGFGHAEGAIDDALIDRIGAWGARPR